MSTSHKSLSKESQQQLFTDARTHHAWLPLPVADEVLRSVYELSKWGPTSVNCCPMRIIFVKSAAEKEKLYPCLSPGNIDQCKAAPVVALIAYDMKFYDKLPILFPAFDAKSMFASNPVAVEPTAFRNGSLEGAYFMMAARTLGLDVCPMSGFDNNKLDEAFFKGTDWKSNFICNIGHGDSAKLHPRGPRLSFNETCKIV